MARKTCGHTASLVDVPWSDGQQCLRCGWDSWETPEQRLRRLERRIADLREEVAEREGDALEAEIRRLEGGSDEGEW